MLSFITITLLLVLSHAFFVAAEFSINNIRAAEVKEMGKSADPKEKRVLEILTIPPEKDHYLAITQVGLAMASLSLGMYGQPHLANFVAPYMARWLGAEPQPLWPTFMSYLFSLGLLTYLHTVLGQMVPRSIAIFSAKRVALFVVPPMDWLGWLFGKPIALLYTTSRVILKSFGLTPTMQQPSLTSSEELELIVTESVEEGLLKDIIHKILIFSERQVNQVMTPRPKIKAISDSAPLAEILECVAESPYSRHPVYQENSDHIIGILHVKDLVHHQLRAKGNFDLRLLLRPAPTVPEHYPVSQLLTSFQKKRIHMAIVLDEFGGTAGIVTLEDLVEEIVGEVRDEFDAELDPMMEHGPGTLEVTGRYLIDDLTHYVDLGEEENLPDVETVGGLITTVLGRPPQPQDEVKYNAIRFTVLSIDGLAVARARIDFSVVEEGLLDEA